jgi:hypothetical protein
MEYTKFVYHLKINAYNLRADGAGPEGADPREVELYLEELLKRRKLQKLKVGCGRWYIFH